MYRTHRNNNSGSFLLFVVFAILAAVILPWDAVLAICNLYGPYVTLGLIMVGLPAGLYWITLR